MTLDQSLEEAHECLFGTLDHPAEAILLLIGGEIRGEEEGLEIVVAGQHVDKLDELLANHVEQVTLGGDLEERPRVDLGDLFH